MSGPAGSARIYFPPSAEGGSSGPRWAVATGPFDEGTDPGYYPGWSEWDNYPNGIWVATFVVVEGRYYSWLQARSVNEPMPAFIEFDPDHLEWFDEGHTITRAHTSGCAWVYFAGPSSVIELGEQMMVCDPLTYGDGGGGGGGGGGGS